jgi:hypothetical protein
MLDNLMHFLDTSIWLPYFDDEEDQELIKNLIAELTLAVVSIFVKDDSISLETATDLIADYLGRTNVSHLLKA